ncbi:B9 domain-containing protein 1-like isoform X2 [Neocloeon triangulifer]|uniref:B9 domain-containing protein 1-like isoform X2 n=1 Tax=Neocloeon triangulifer TaxID=2078957 RepID=UPI00286F818C|nr:B9 domain-containing protein 1-like isoform X2 [Neocloeon triangulifer]
MSKDVSPNNVGRLSAEELSSRTLAVGGSHFIVSVNGAIEAADFPEYDELYCRYFFDYGSDWQIISGVSEGMSQISKKSKCHVDERQLCIWNLPVELTLKSTNISGWPKIVVSVYGTDTFGNDVVRGYAWSFVPLESTSCTISMPAFVPASSSRLQEMTAWFTGRRPEFLNPATVAHGESRELLRTNSHGVVMAKLNALTKDLARCGYETSSREPRSFNLASIVSDMEQLSIK